VQKSASGLTLYWYGATGNVLAETSSTGALLSEYVFFNGKRVARRDADNTVKFYYSDALGSASVIAVVKNNVATILAESDYLPYGGEIPIITGDPNHYKFTGKERDLESGLDNFGARYNASSLGRFMTPDWAAKATSVPYASFGDPQTLNLYSYVENEPLDRIDADGHDEIGHSPVEGIPYFCSSAGGTSTVQCREKTFNVHSSNDVAQAQKLRINIIFSSSLSDKQKARAMGLLGHAEVGLARAGIKTKETGSQTLDFDQIKSGKGMDKGALNVVFGTNEDFSGTGSGSDKRGGVLASMINIAKQGDDETIVQFEFAQALTTTHSKYPVIGMGENAVKDSLFTPFLNAAMDGTSGSIKAANVLTFGGVSEMRRNALQYSDPDQ